MGAVGTSLERRRIATLLSLPFHSATAARLRRQRRHDRLQRRVDTEGDRIFERRPSEIGMQGIQHDVELPGFIRFGDDRAGNDQSCRQAGITPPFTMNSAFNASRICASPRSREQRAVEGRQRFARHLALRDQGRLLVRQVEAMMPNNCDRIVRSGGTATTETAALSSCRRASYAFACRRARVCGSLRAGGFRTITIIQPTGEKGFNLNRRTSRSCRVSYLAV